MLIDWVGNEEEEAGKDDFQVLSQTSRWLVVPLTEEEPWKRGRFGEEFSFTHTEDEVDARYVNGSHPKNDSYVEK